MDRKGHNSALSSRKTHATSLAQKSQNQKKAETAELITCTRPTYHTLRKGNLFSKEDPGKVQSSPQSTHARRKADKSSPQNTLTSNCRPFKEKRNQKKAFRTSIRLSSCPYKAGTPGTPMAAPWVHKPPAWEPQDKASLGPGSQHQLSDRIHIGNSCFPGDF